MGPILLGEDSAAATDPSPDLMGAAASLQPSPSPSQLPWWLGMAWWRVSPAFLLPYCKIHIHLFHLDLQTLNMGASIHLTSPQLIPQLAFSPCLLQNLHQEYFPSLYQSLVLVTLL